jgi:hypothetical protein
VKTLSRVLVTLVVGAGLASTAAANLVVNPGFETGNFTGWTQIGDTTFTGVDTLSAHSGSFGADMGPIGSLGFISQDLAAVAGATYDLTFWLANIADRFGNVTPNRFEASWNGSVIPASVLDNVAPAFPTPNSPLPGCSPPVQQLLSSLVSGTTLPVGGSMMSQ